MLLQDIKVFGKDVKQKVEKLTRKMKHKVYSHWMHKGILKIKHDILELVPLAVQLFKHYLIMKIVLTSASQTLETTTTLHLT